MKDKNVCTWITDGNSTYVSDCGSAFTLTVKRSEVLVCPTCGKTIEYPKEGLRHKVGDEVYVNFNDGVKKSKILQTRGNKYVVNMGGVEIEMKENEVSLEAKVIKGVSPLLSVGCQEEAGA